MSAPEKTPGPDTLDEVGEVVRHTDSGSGASQAEHWPASETPPDEVKPEAPDRPFKDAGSI